MKIIKNNYFYRLAASYIAILLLSVIMGVCFYDSGIKTAKKFHLSQSQALLDNSVRSIDSDFMKFDSVCKQISLSNIHMLSYSTIKSNSFYYRAYTAQEQLKSIQSPYSSSRNSYVVYLPNSSYMVSSVHCLTADTYNRYYYQSAFFALLSKTISLDKNNTGRLIRDTATNNYYYVVDMKPEYKINAKVFFDISPDNIQNHLSNLSINNNSYVFITDKSENVIYTTNGDISVNDIIHSDGKVCSINNAKYAIMTSTSTYNGWKYYYLTRDSEISRSLGGLRNQYILFIIAVLIAGLTIASILSRLNAKPILMLNNQLNETKNKYSTLIQSNKNYKAEVEKHYIRSLLLGFNFSSDESQYIKETLAIDPKTSHSFYVLCIKIYNSVDSVNIITDAESSESNIDYSLIESKCINYLSCRHWFVRIAKDQYGILLLDPEESEDQLIFNIQKIILNIHNDLLSNNAIWLYAGLSEKQFKLENIWLSYLQGKEAIESTTKNYIFLPYKFCHQGPDQYYMPSALTLQLTASIQHTDKSKIADIFDILYHENFEKRVLSNRSQSFLLSEIRICMIHIINENGLQLPDEFNNDMYWNSLKGLEKIAMYLSENFDNIESEDQITEILKYINENYTDSSLCLAKISEKFNISGTYFSHLFKEKTGDNFLNYVKNLKMKYAAELIQSGEENINGMYEKVGYNNAATFRRIFKQTYGMSPSEMKEKFQTRELPTVKN